ncbi:hypothetical protein PL482_21135 [Bacteroides xylanisolvens]|uniref:hypothetical protein n=1 Tax=Bacteroides TaxID=816 RepID=UPI00124AAACF|nr:MULTISPECIES: hypothetical protein [Bacteroides]MDB0713551.1 hypothetical protein [Bacteroides xylanisolvens]MDC2757261.1 hypothetical protein [Bacteroides ovatus]MDF0566602.1 hypothetical protein [Bacteroides xylanisolvens]UVQ10680.1 hypothetical protein NXW81_25215 [Bacteroides xylanisolvens]
MIQIIVLLLPILGLIGYFADLQWLFLTGSIGSLFFTLVALFTKQLTPTSIKWLIIASIAGWIISSSFINGVLLGICSVTAFSTIFSIFVILNSRR